MAIAHHCVVYLACRQLNVDWHSLPYAMLGDDLVICNKQVAKQYIEIIQSLGVEIQMSKSYESQHLFEFCKRNFYKDLEITPFPLPAIDSGIKSACRLVPALIAAEEKGYVAQDIALAITELLSLVKTVPGRVRTKLKSKYRSFEAMIRIIGGHVSALDGLTTILGEYPVPLAEALTEHKSSQLMQRLALSLFESSSPTNPETSIRKEPLGELVLMMVIELTG